ncbi:hypothetical protein [Aeromonas jandaei]|uniref:hypothetical protein n=1 Tax=Aeromonas jandaei TaxID=650 RepID=UPI003BA24BA7
MTVALLIAESVWFTPKSNKGQASFLEYSKAIENLLRFELNNNSFSSYKASFYDKKSLELCLDHLIDTEEDRQVLYVGAHGDGRKISDAKIKDVSNVITERSNKIKGLFVSSCWAADSDHLACHANWSIDRNFNIVNGPNWIASYRNAVDWHLSALIEMHLLYTVCNQYTYNPLEMNNGDNIISVFRKALSIFNKKMELGANGESLESTFRLWIRPQGSKSLRDVTTQLF